MCAAGTSLPQLLSRRFNEIGRSTPMPKTLALTAVQVHMRITASKSSKPLSRDCAKVGKRKQRKQILLITTLVGGACLLVFKATFQDGMVLSIRRLVNGSIDEAMFGKQAELLGKVKHRNITVLRGYYYASSPDSSLLVYDYMPNGNLATLFQEASNQEGHMLNWPMLHLISLDIARGLAFLHSLSIVHGDVKPQNVLFDPDFEVHLSEFGLEGLVVSTPEGVSSSSTLVGTLGYVVPEVVLTRQPTKESEVYNFGILLFEILTGRKSVMFSQDEYMVKWVKKQLEKRRVYAIST